VTAQVPFPIELVGLGNEAVTLSLRPAEHEPIDHKDLTGPSALLASELLRSPSFPGPSNGGGLKVTGGDLLPVQGVCVLQISVTAPGNYFLLVSAPDLPDAIQTSMFGVRQHCLEVIALESFPDEWLKDSGPKNKAIEFEVRVNGFGAISDLALNVILGYSNSSLLPSQVSAFWLAFVLILEPEKRQRAHGDGGTISNTCPAGATIHTGYPPKSLRVQHCRTKHNVQNAAKSGRRLKEPSISPILLPHFS